MQELCASPVQKQFYALRVNVSGLQIEFKHNSGVYYSISDNIAYSQKVYASSAEALGSQEYTDLLNYWQSNYGSNRGGQWFCPDPMGLWYWIDGLYDPSLTKDLKVTECKIITPGIFTVEAFTEIAKTGGSEPVYSTGPNDLLERIRETLAEEEGESLDLVICLDTTGSMRDDIDEVRKGLIPVLQEITREFASFRTGMILYKDYYEEYLTREIPFTADFDVFQRNLNAIRVGGGRDIPEAVYEALHDGAVKFPWASEPRLMILTGDAPPHPRARGRITKEMTDSAVAERDIKVRVIILPQ